jgi:vacuolar protein sorting-associated protein 3
MILLQTYETYRALNAPRPTYRQFITDNALEAEWWESRLRLLQLLGSKNDAASSYDVPTMLARLGPYEQELIPEMIILNGRRGRHEDAIRLLTHGLSDYDTAISYCLLGGSSIFRGPAAGYLPETAIPTKDEQAKLFGYLLREFLQIEDVTERIDRTGELLERFGGWFDVKEVLALIPDGWSIDVLSGFLISALRRLVRDKSESTITKALSGAQNLKTAVDLIDRMDELGVVVQRE